MADENGIVWSESSFVNSRGRKIYTQQWVRPDAKGIIVLCHGYGDHSHWWITASAKKYSAGGLSAFAFDQEGHGKSEGLSAFVPDFDLLVDDAIHYIEMARAANPGLKCFLQGGSMGGAIVLLIALKRPDLMDGIILASPMIKVKESAKPHPLVVQVLKGMAYFFPTWAIVPSVSVIDIAFREEKYRQMARENPYSYKGRVRLGTGLAIINICDYLEANLKNITKPLIILHGTGDLVTSHESSEELFNVAKSTDKTLVLYEGMWHVLPSEPNAALIDEDIAAWVRSRIEGEQICNERKFVPIPESPSLANGANQI